MLCLTYQRTKTPVKMELMPETEICNRFKMSVVNHAFLKFAKRLILVHHTLIKRLQCTKSNPNSNWMRTKYNKTLIQTHTKKFEDDENGRILMGTDLIGTCKHKDDIFASLITVESQTYCTTTVLYTVCECIMFIILLLHSNECLPVRNTDNKTVIAVSVMFDL